jgi:PcfJ-like protein
MGMSPKLWAYSTEHSRTWASEKPKLVYSPERHEAFELQAFRKSMRHGKRGRYGAHRDFPIEQFMANNIGNDYDTVFSELLTHIPKRLRYCSQIDEKWTLPKTYHPEGDKKHFFGGNRYGGMEFYVDLETKILHCVELGDFYKPFEKEVFTLKRRGKTFIFQQLTSSDAFRDEGKTLNHCVASFRKKCRRLQDETSIWSFGIALSVEKIEKILTIQITSGEIKQVRGYINRYPSKNERDMIREWAYNTRLTIANRAFGWGNY